MFTRPTRGSGVPSPGDSTQPGDAACVARAANVVARKNTQPTRDTSEGQQHPQSSAGGALEHRGPAADAVRCSRVKMRWPISSTPCSTPQITNVQLAPCHRPPSVIVIIRLRYVCQRAAAAAAQRDEQIIAQPGRQRDVPAPPEVRDVRRQVRHVEVLRQLVAEQVGDADGHVGVAGEVAVDLHGVGEHGQPDRVGTIVPCGLAKIGSANTAMRSAMASFLNRPIRKNCVPEVHAAASPSACGGVICGRKSSARTIGPATRCGKNRMNSMKSARFRSAGLRGGRRRRCS